MKKKIINISLGLGIVTSYILYSYYKFNTIYKFPPIMLLVNIIDALVKKINILLSNVVGTFTDPQVIKWSMIFIVVVYLIYKIDINNLISNISEINWDQRFIKMKAEALNNDEVERRRELEESDSSEAEEAIEKIDKRIEIINLIREYPYIARLLDKWINRRISKTHIPLSTVINEVGDLSIIGNFFEYDMKNNSIVLKGLKEEYKEEIVEIYSELINNK